jgi:hypothetical protein
MLVAIRTMISAGRSTRLIFVECLLFEDRIVASVLFRQKIGFNGSYTATHWLDCPFELAVHEYDDVERQPCCPTEVLEKLLDHEGADEKSWLLEHEMEMHSKTSLGESSKSQTMNATEGAHSQNPSSQGKGKSVL